jgi:hypothetical protein
MFIWVQGKSFSARNLDPKINGLTLKILSRMKIVKSLWINGRNSSTFSTEIWTFCKITTKFDSEIFRNEAISVTFIKISLLSGIGITGSLPGLSRFQFTYDTFDFHCIIMQYYTFKLLICFFWFLCIL